VIASNFSKLSKQNNTMPFRFFFALTGLAIFQDSVVATLKLAIAF
jgi:hypothetical protein